MVQAWFQTTYSDLVLLKLFAQTLQLVCLCSFEHVVYAVLPLNNLQDFGSWLSLFGVAWKEEIVVDQLSVKE